jgi:hypothetical protein
MNVSVDHMIPHMRGVIITAAGRSGIAR